MIETDSRSKGPATRSPVSGSSTENTIKIDCLAKKFLCDPTTFFMLPPATPLVGPADPVEDSFAPMDQEEAEKLLLDGMTNGLCLLQEARAFIESGNQDGKNCGTEILNNAIEKLKTLNSLPAYILLAYYQFETSNADPTVPLDNVEKVLDLATQELDNLPSDYPLEFKEDLMMKLLSGYYMLFDCLEIRKTSTKDLEAKIEQFKVNYVVNNPNLSVFDKAILPHVRKLEKAQMLGNQSHLDSARELYKEILAELKDPNDMYGLLDRAACLIGIASFEPVEKRESGLKQAWEDLDLARDLFNETFSEDSVCAKSSFCQALISSYFRIKMLMPAESDMSEMDARISDSRLQLNNMLSEPKIPPNPRRKREVSSSFPNALTTSIFALFSLAILGFLVFKGYKLIRRTYTH